MTKIKGGPDLVALAGSSKSYKHSVIYSVSSLHPPAIELIITQGPVS